MKVKVKAPKAPKAVSKAISGATKAVSTAAKGAGGAVSQIAQSAAKGDIKGIASGVSGAVQTAKDFTKDMAKSQLDLSTGGLERVGGLFGSGDVSQFARNVNREGASGVNKYGDVAMDVGANIATGGTYGAAQSALGAVQSGGLKALLNPKQLQQQALQAGAAYAGINPEMLKAAQGAMSGDLKGAALQSLGSYAGISPEQMKMAQTGLSALSGDKQGLVSGLASQFGAGENMSKIAGSIAGGTDPKALALQSAGSLGGLDPRLLKGDIGGVAPDFSKIYSEKVEPQLRQLTAAEKKAMEQQKMIQKTVSEKGIMDATSRVVLGKNGKPLIINGKTIPNDLYDEKLADELNIAKQQGNFEKVKEIQERAKTPYSVMSEEQKKQIESQGKSWWDKTKDFMSGAKEAVKSGAGAVGGAISGAAGAARDFAAENKTALGLAAQGAAAVAGYKAGQEGREAATGLSKEQLAELQKAGQTFEQQAYDPTRYAQEKQFLQERVAGGGLTAQEKQLQQQGDIRAARMAAAARLSGQEQMARMGRGVTGAGAALAASLAGGQSVMGEQSATNLAREASASERLQKDIERQTMLSRQQTAEEAELARQQGEFGLQRAQQTSAVRSNLAQMEQQKATALQNLYGRGADLATVGLQSMKTEAEKQAEAKKAEDDARLKQAEIQKKEAEAQQSQAAVKAQAAQKISTQGTAKPTTSTSQQSQTQGQAAGQFNQQNIPKPGQGQGYGVLAPIQQAGQQVQSMADQAKQKAEEFKKNPFGFKF
jgi:hypothetical protein